jgi:hypothetical protein
MRDPCPCFLHFAHDTLSNAHGCGSVDYGTGSFEVRAFICCTPVCISLAADLERATQFERMEGKRIPTMPCGCHLPFHVASRIYMKDLVSWVFSQVEYRRKTAVYIRDYILLA